MTAGVRPAPLCAWCEWSMDQDAPTHASWGDWRCSRCGEATCHDCGARVSGDGMCMAYEEMQANFVQLEADR